MPEADGWDLLAAMREIHPSLPVVVMTGIGNEEIAVDLIQAGAANYLSKPVNEKRLIGIVGMLLNRVQSCFISYSHTDEEFAKRLYEAMCAEQLRVWFAPEDMQGGHKLIEQIDRAIQVNDRLLLVLSGHSMNSEWVQTEIRKARQAELREQRQKLFPIRLVSIDRIRDWSCFDADTGKDLAVELREYHIPDFSNWKSHDAFESAFADLLRDLRAQA